MKRKSSTGSSRLISKVLEQDTQCSHSVKKSPCRPNVHTLIISGRIHFHQSNRESAEQQECDSERKQWEDALCPSISLFVFLWHPTSCQGAVKAATQCFLYSHFSESLSRQTLTATLQTSAPADRIPASFLLFDQNPDSVEGIWLNLCHMGQRRIRHWGIWTKDILWPVTMQQLSPPMTLPCAANTKWSE